MNTKPAAPVIFTVSLVVLIGGGAGTAAWGGPVSDDRSSTQVVGIVRGHVVVRDDLSPLRAFVEPNAGTLEAVVPQSGAFSAEALRELHSQGVAPQAVPEFSADARRELHSQAVAQQPVQGFTAEARRELHSQGVAPQAVPEFSADARRELHSQAVAPQAGANLSADAMRELKGSAPQSARELSADARRELHPQSAGTTAADAQGQRLAAYAEAVAGTERPSASDMQGQRLAAYADAVDAAPQSGTVAEVRPHGLTR
jgi:hypothetical protein